MRWLVLLHRWIGAVLALAVLLVTASGALLLFADDYLRWRLPELAASGPVVPPDPAALATVVRQAADAGGTIAFPRPSLPAYVHYLPDGGQRLHHPRDGRLVATWDRWDTVPGVLFEVHVHLLAGETGHQVLGWIALLLVLLVLSGLPLWWRLRRGLPLRRPLPRSSQSVELLRSHSAQGVLVGIAILFMALSGAALVFHAQAAAVLNGVFGAQGPLQPQSRELDAPVSLDDADWASLLGRAATTFPDATVRMLSLPRSSTQPITLRLRRAAELHPNGRTYLLMDPRTGDVLDAVDATRTGAGPAVLNALYPLHAGKTGWTGHRAVLLLLALCIGWIVLSGAWLFLRRQGRRNRTA